MCVCVCVWKRKRKRKEKKKKEKKKKGIIAGQKQPLGAVWCCVVQGQGPQQWQSALPDQWCNSSTSTMLAHSRAIVAYDNGRSKVYLCVCVCVCVSRTILVTSVSCKISRYRKKYYLLAAFTILGTISNRVIVAMLGGW